MSDEPVYDVPERFRASRKALFVDALMNRVIKVGGVSIILAVFGIFVFILWQILPLFSGAKIAETGRLDVNAAADESHLIILDEWGETVALPQADGSLRVARLDGTGEPNVVRPFPEDLAVESLSYDATSGMLAAGSADGRVVLAPVDFAASYTGENGAREIGFEVGKLQSYQIGPEGGRVRQSAYGDAGSSKLLAALVEVGDRVEARAVTLSQRRGLMGGGQLRVDGSHDLTPLIEGRPARLLVSRQADSVIVVTEDGWVNYLFREGGSFVLRQRFAPFGDQEDQAVAMAGYILGDVSLYFANAAGDNRVFSLYLHREKNERLFGQTKEFAPLPGAPVAFAASSRNKAFAVVGEGFLSLRYTTTEAVRWESSDLDVDFDAVVINGKYDAIVARDERGDLVTYALDDPHPEASFDAFFGKIWYEGQSAPEYSWQSTGGSDDFEPKLSLVPLIVGSLKGTLYAMLFAVPLALGAAVYTSQFLTPEIKRVVKPTMETMASLPSVVLGFIAALWLAPILDTRVPSLMLICLFVPVAAVSAGSLWNRLPQRLRLALPKGMEFLAVLPLLAFAAYLGWTLGPVFERFAFVVTDPNTGARVADFRLWWPEFTGASYTSRNSLVVGFVMGFAVIPIVFTISEDALSNVPETLRSGSLALGASRWQTAVRIVLPTAMAGIFSALMIGLGRAVGETMIVVMATGNTPIMDLNIFSGMRTLSANIAVELPEAPHHGTLYRTLFLGAMVLFVLTFILNTFAEIMRQRIRARFSNL